MRTVLVIRLMIIFIGILLVLENFGYVVIDDGKFTLAFQDTSDSVNTILKDVEEKSSESFQEVSNKIASEIPEYQLQLKQVRRLEDCVEVRYDEKDPCLLINLELKNQHEESLAFEITRKAIVTSTGKQIDRYGGFFENKELNKLCDTYTSVRLFPNANKNIGMCFPLVTKNEKPVLYVGISTVGENKEFNIDLTSYIT